MKTVQPSGKPKKPAEEKIEDLAALLCQKVVGQPAVAEIIVPYIQMFQAGLAPEGRPVGVFLLLGPTGTGKTKTVEALAEVLHGSEKNLLKVDCGEFQMEHEVAKLIGAPPGYLGHRETQPILTQQKLNSVTSEKSVLSIVLFDEIEKAAPSMTRLLLGVLDKATLRLGDNTAVNFEKSLVFLTSNLGAREMLKEISPDFGFQAGVKKEKQDLTGKLQAIGDVNTAFANRATEASIAGARRCDSTMRKSFHLFSLTSEGLSRFSGNCTWPLMRLGTSCCPCPNIKSQLFRRHPASWMCARQC